MLQNENGTYVLGQQGAIPTFCDIDGDNDLDFFAVNLIGTVSFYENIGINDNKPIFNFITSDWENISIVGQFRHGANAINFIDLDNDLDFDLVWGITINQVYMSFGTLVAILSQIWITLIF